MKPSFAVAVVNRFRKLLSEVLLLILLLLLIAVTGCSDDSVPDDISRVASELPRLSINGFEVPGFPNAETQLNHAKSSFADPEEKRAALQAVITFFPEERLPCARASLYLAYMHLGQDYRFAEKKQALKAVAAYEQVIEKYHDLPEIVVKAYWYKGWIYCEIAAETEKGLAAYNHIVEHFPRLEMGILPPVPWVSLVYPVERPNERPADDQLTKQWASIALLEIVRHAADERMIWSAFAKLWENYPISIATGPALKHILQHRHEYGGDIDRALPFVDAYLKRNIANPHLAREIRAGAGKSKP